MYAAKSSRTRFQPFFSLRETNERYTTQPVRSCLLTLCAQVLDRFKELGQKIAQVVRQDGQYLSPLLAAFTARVITLEQPAKFGIDGSGFNAAGKLFCSLFPTQPPFFSM